jgi:hypothetical protein
VRKIIKCPHGQQKQGNGGDEFVGIGSGNLGIGFKIHLAVGYTV